MGFYLFNQTCYKVFENVIRFSPDCILVSITTVLLYQRLFCFSLMNTKIKLIALSWFFQKKNDLFVFAGNCSSVISIFFVAMNSPLKAVYKWKCNFIISLIVSLVFLNSCGRNFTSLIKMNSKSNIKF